MSDKNARYKIFHRIGAGGYGAVHLGAIQGSEDVTRRVAIKRLSLTSTADAPSWERFAREAQLLARLSHPNIVSVMDYQVDESGPYLVMEYVDGCTLARCVSLGACPPSAAVYVAAELLRALGYIHCLPAEAGMRGIVHRDVSPQNILLSWDGMVRLSDFGISRVMDTFGGVQSHTYRGNAAYSSPEHINGKPADGRADLFSAGVVLWEMLSGRHLFFGETQGVTMARVLLGQVPAPSPTRALSPDLEAIVMRLLARKPENRYATAEDALSDLLKCEEWPRSGRDELSALLAGRFRRDQRQILSVADPDQKLPAGEPSLETRTAAPTTSTPRDASTYDWDALASLVAESSAREGKERPRTGGGTSTKPREGEKRPRTGGASTKPLRRSRARLFLAASAVALAAFGGLGYVVQGHLARPPGQPDSETTLAHPLAIQPEPALPVVSRVDSPPAGPPFKEPAPTAAPPRGGAPRRERASLTRERPPASVNSSPAPSRYPETMRYILGEAEEAPTSTTNHRDSTDPSLETGTAAAAPVSTRKVDPGDSGSRSIMRW